MGTDNSDEQFNTASLILLSHMINPYPRNFKTGEQIQEKPPARQNY